MTANCKVEHAATPKQQIFHAGDIRKSIGLLVLVHIKLFVKSMIKCRLAGWEAAKLVGYLLQ